MKFFLVGLQFLTRIKVVNQTAWTVEDFGKSVAFFPLIGLVIGIVLYGLYLLLLPVAPPFLLAVLLVFAEFIITGGLHADGLMDTVDGIFSGRLPERMLEIMKDSRVGSNGVVAFVFLVLLKIAFLLALPAEKMQLALLAMPIISRFAMVISIKKFPYARKEGMGKSFALYSSKQALRQSFIFTIAPCLYFRYDYIILVGIGMLVALLMNRYIQKKIGGVTGDTYGAVTECSELIILAAVLFIV